MRGALSLPPADSVLLLLDAVKLGVDLGAKLAFSIVWCGNRLHDEFDTTSLASAVLFGTVLTEVSPLKVTT